jgi:adenylate cyclase
MTVAGPRTMQTAMNERPGRIPVSVPTWFLPAIALPLVGLAVLIARPELDHEWRHQPSHFWLVLGVAVVSVALAYVTHEAATRHRDARLVLISLAFGASAGFLALHALATPGVLLAGSNLGFVIATPVGLTVAAVLAAASALPLGGPRGALVLRHADHLRLGLGAVLIAWGVASLIGLPPLQAGPAPAEVAMPFRLVALASVVLYAYAAWHFVRLLLIRRRPLLLATVVAFVLLAEAMVTVIFSRDWHLSWWEWHLLMALAFASVAIGARVEYRRERSLTGAFGALYLNGTLERLDRWHADALSEMAGARAEGRSTARVVERLRLDGATREEVTLLERASVELHRVGELFRPFVPHQFADRARSDPAEAKPGSGEEREVTVLFADLSGFTAYSERRKPTEVVDLLNQVWTATVPIIAAHDGLIESFAGDGVLVLFNAFGDQPDHARRAARAAVEMRAAVDEIGGAAGDRPRFHIGINSGRAYVGSIGAAGRRAFSAIGDTTNLAARLQGAARSGEIVIGDATWGRLEDARGQLIDALALKGKRLPVRAWRLEALGSG